MSSEGKDAILMHEIAELNLKLNQQMIQFEYVRLILMCAMVIFIMLYLSGYFTKESFKPYLDVHSVRRDDPAFDFSEAKKMYNERYWAENFNKLRKPAVYQSPTNNPELDKREEYLNEYIHPYEKKNFVPIDMNDEPLEETRTCNNYNPLNNYSPYDLY
jgi:hypothetical protein